jgi:4-amino-4-deoxy-L-arabinose transferase-like glycosyltransferase
LQWRWGPLVFLAIAAPWFIAIAFISKGRFYEVAMGRHVIHRMTNPMEEHGGFPGFYLVMTLFVMFPWSAFLPPALLSGWRERRSVPAVGFLAGWILGPLIMLELVRTKLIHYDMPAMPPMVLFAAWWLDRVAESQLNVRRWALGRFAAGLLCAVGMAIVVVVAAVAWRGPAELRAPSILLALIAAAGGLWSMERYWSGATEAATRALLATSALGLATCFGWFFPALEPHRLTQNTARRLSELSNENRALAMLAEFKPPGMVWEMGRPVPLIESRAELRRQVTQGGPVVTAVTEDGWRLFSRDPSFEVSELDRTRGLDLERGRFSEVRLIKITAREPASVARGAEKSNVK